MYIVAMLSNMICLDYSFIYMSFCGKTCKIK